MRHALLTGLLLLSLQTFSQTAPANTEDKKDTVGVYNPIDDDDKVFTRTEIEASFPGGLPAWNRYISSEMNKIDFSKFTDIDQGTCRVRFIVGKDGRVKDVTAMTMKNTSLAKAAVAIIEKSPRWKPAMQNGRKVNAYREQPIVFNFEKEKK